MATTDRTFASREKPRRRLAELLGGYAEDVIRKAITVSVIDNTTFQETALTAVIETSPLWRKRKLWQQTTSLDDIGPARVSVLRRSNVLRKRNADTCQINLLASRHGLCLPYHKRAT